MGIFGRSLSLQMAIATLLGILVGLFFGDRCASLAPWASAYIMILKVTVVPYLMTAIIHGVGQMSHSQGKLILKRGVLFIVLVWAINIIMIYAMITLFPRPDGIQHPGYSLPKTGSINFADLLIPENIFYDLSNNVIPAIVVFSLFIGLALMQLKEKQFMMSFLETFVDALTRITMWISRITPIGTLLIIANQVGTIQFATVKQISTYIILYILCISLIVFWIFPHLISMLTPVRAFKWLKDMLPILILAYTTNVVIVCLPYIMQLIQKETQETYPKDERALIPTQGIVSVLFNLPLGSLFVSFFVFFAAIFYQFPLSFSANIELFATTFLTGLGAVGIGSWINSLNFLFDSLGLPLDGINLYLTTLPFTAGFQSIISTMEIASLSFLITLACRRLIHWRWPRLLRGILVIVLPILLLIIGVKSFNPLPRIHNESKGMFDLTIYPTVKATIFPPENLKTFSPSLGEDSLDRVLRTQILRVGYHPKVPPFCFYNREGEVVGYDIALAYELAHDLGCNLELVPMTYGNLKEELESGLYDIAMSAISMTEERLKYLSFPRSYLNAKIVFVTRDTKRKAFATRPLNTHLKIGVLKGSSFESLAKQLFPNHSLILLNDYEDLLKEEEVDAVLWEEQEAIAWVIEHPHFNIIFPEPSLGIDSFSYPVKADALRFLNFLNQWLVLKKQEGFLEKEYNLWILRKPERSPSEKPRWSVLRNVFHWN
jgi:Na+/H+-dicarboxylate symporter/ABC-type amino acid transport substrate-binding protein